MQVKHPPTSFSDVTAFKTKYAAKKPQKPIISRHFYHLPNHFPNREYDNPIPEYGNPSRENDNPIPEYGNPSRENDNPIPEYDNPNQERSNPIPEYGNPSRENGNPISE